VNFLISLNNTDQQMTFLYLMTKSSLKIMKQLMQTMLTGPSQKRLELMLLIQQQTHTQ
jgi:hypothetical protein